MEARKDAILTALSKWIHQRPGLEFGNYGDRAAYLSEMRSITRDLHQARTLLRAVTWRDSITADDLIAACRAYSGRLQIKEQDGKARIEYCTGQYWPTEYRRAACAVLAQALWDNTREHSMPSAIVKDGYQFYPHCSGHGNEQTAGDWLRGHFRREFGRGMQQRWFD